MPPVHDAIVLAGGRGARMGGVDKAAVVVAGRPLLERVLEATGAARQTVVVGPVAAPEGVTVTSEDPPGGGPVAGVAAGLAALTAPLAPWVLILAVDQPDAAAAVSPVLAAASEVSAVGTAATTAADEIDGICQVDRTGREQWLLAVYRSDRLLAALAELGTVRHGSVRRLVAGLRLAHVTAGHEHVGDIDTWEDARAWDARLGSAAPTTSMPGAPPASGP